MLIFAAAGIAVTGLYAPALSDAFTTDDFPGWAVAKGVSAGSLVRVVIDPNGKVIECNNVHAAGDSNLALEACKVLNGKKLKRPTLRNGSNVYATGESFIKFAIPDTAEGKRIEALRTKPDAEITVNRIPPGDPDVSVTLAYDASGMVTDCTAADWEENKLLADIACGQRSIFENTVFKAPSGEPVAYISWKKVRFILSSPPK